MSRRARADRRSPGPLETAVPKQDRSRSANLRQLLPRAAPSSLHNKFRWRYEAALRCAHTNSGKYQVVAIVSAGRGEPISGRSYRFEEDEMKLMIAAVAA